MYELIQVGPQSWYIESPAKVGVYRVNEKEHIEIWAGDGFKAENGPVYRVYPQPCDWYEVS